MLTGKSVLVVDDEGGIRDLASRAFAAAGYKTYRASNGKEALKVMAIEHVDLAVMDIIMPDKEGVETILEIKLRWPDCKILAISGGGRIGADDFLELARRVGADATMKKPLRFPEMVQTAETILAPI